METNQKNRKKQKIGNLIISEEITSVQSCQNLEKKMFTQMSITSSKMKIFELTKNEN
jgi:hypothetical protein